MKSDFFRLGVFSPEVKLADPFFNSAEIHKLVVECPGLALAVFPELSISGYSCGDLFFQEALIEKSRCALLKLISDTSALPTVLLVGVPVCIDGRLYNCGACIQQGKLLGLVPKSELPNYNEFYEKRYFSSGKDITGRCIKWPEYDELIPFGVDLLFDDGNIFQCGMEICEDLWSVNPPGSDLALHGARMIANLSATPEQLGKSSRRRRLIAEQSARTSCVYLFSSAGMGESSADLTFIGQMLIADHGNIVSESNQCSSTCCLADVDLRRLDAIRLKEGNFSSQQPLRPWKIRKISLHTPPNSPDLSYMRTDVNPFGDADDREVLSLQCCALGRRLEYLHISNVVLGLSGGLDSAWALIAAAECFQWKKYDLSHLHAISMPGLATGKRTRNQAGRLAEAIGCDFAEIDISAMCKEEFRMLGHPEHLLNTVYENVQARIRTNFLMNRANQCNGIVLGTGNLSELALGFCTYNADHMSMYSMNCSLPKSMIRSIAQRYAERCDKRLAEVLWEILDTPFSPELLPADKEGTLSQSTENILGDYRLHDFFLYHMIRYGCSAAKILELAIHAFAGEYSRREIEQALKIFLQRFSTQQFKRNVMPDGPKITSISLSPRGDWRMPSDASDTLFTL